MAAESKEVLSGAVFEVHDEKGKVVVKVTTDKDGKAKITDLSVGNYTLVEVEAPKGYEKLTNPIPFEITNGMINAVQLEVLNKLNHLAPPGPETPDPENLEHQIQKTWNTRSRKPGTPDPENLEHQIQKNLEHQIQKSLEHQIQKSLEHQIQKSLEHQIQKSLEHQIQKSLEHRIQRNLKKLPKTGQKMPVEPYMGALLVMMSFGLLILGRKQQR